MKRFFLFTMLVLATQAGCGTIVAQLGNQGEQGYYAGVSQSMVTCYRSGGLTMVPGGIGIIPMAVTAVDIPLSAAADTVLIPVTATRNYLHVKREAASNATPTKPKKNLYQVGIE